MRLLILLFILATTTAQASVIWGRKGHRVTGHIAEKHLTRKAKKAIDELLNGHTLAFVSTYADEIKSDSAYDAYFPWHYVNYDLDESYADSDKNPEGDMVTAIEFCKKVLQNPLTTKQEKVFHLKFLVHLIGDLHQPLHAGRLADRGGNDIQVQWFGQGSNLHKVWDTNLLETYGMSYSELGNELDKVTRKKEREAIQKGTVLDWLAESHQLANEIYGAITVGDKLGYDYGYKYNPIVFERLRKGGYRLAKILNEIFG